MKGSFTCSIYIYLSGHEAIKLNMGNLGKNNQGKGETAREQYYLQHFCVIGIPFINLTKHWFFRFLFFFSQNDSSPYFYHLRLRVIQELLVYSKTLSVFLVTDGSRNWNISAPWWWQIPFGVNFYIYSLLWQECWNLHGVSQRGCFWHKQRLLLLQQWQAWQHAGNEQPHFFGIACIMLSLLSAHPSEFGRKIDFTVLLLYLLIPDKRRGTNITFLWALIAKHGHLAHNSVTTDTTQ